jgi:hypothetical protein
MIFVLISFFLAPRFSPKGLHPAYASRAEILLYETKQNQADILIYKVDYASQVNPAEGLWLDVNKSQADWLSSGLNTSELTVSFTL